MPVSRIGQMLPGRLSFFDHLRLTAHSCLQRRTALCAIRSDRSSELLRGRIDRDHAMGTVAKCHRFGKGIAKKMECLAQLHLN